MGMDRKHHRNGLGLVPTTSSHAITQRVGAMDLAQQRLDRSWARGMRLDGRYLVQIELGIVYGGPRAYE